MPSSVDWSSDVCSDRKSTRLNSSHQKISDAVFCLKKNRCPTEGTGTIPPAGAVVNNPTPDDHFTVGPHCGLPGAGRVRVGRGCVFFFIHTGTTETSAFSLPGALPF